MMTGWEDFAGLNAGYILELYDRYRQNPESVDAATRAFFSHWVPPTDGREVTPEAPADKIVAVARLARAIRAFGHLAAHLDPLGTHARGDPALELGTYGLSEQDLRRLPPALVGGPVAERSANALEAIGRLRKIYSGTAGFDYDQVHIPEEREWLREHVEAETFCPPQDPINPSGLLERLSEVEAFEHFLHRVFPGKTRFSLEGLDMLIPILDDVIGEAAEKGIRNVLIGMAHRGRLNVLAHVLGKPYRQILAEFKDPVRSHDYSARESLGWTGDVKYHAGARRAVETGQTMNVVITMPPNPSHVESADPVVEGMARAAISDLGRAGPPRLDLDAALPILIHGDAAFSGQGIVAETLNLSRLAGYQTGGTIHVIANNQLGYTTKPDAGRSTLYASDLAKGFEIPIIHVNADDVEACIQAARLASAYRARFHKDFLIDLIGYRRYGHNEGDEPTFTQPIMYAEIAGHPSVRKIWADELVRRGEIEPETERESVDKYSRELQRILESLHPEQDIEEPFPEPPPPRAAQQVKTGVPIKRLRTLYEALLSIPPEFTPNPKLERALKRRRAALDNPDKAEVDWATAEELALGTILEDGIPIRLTGEDVERGTFGQRHSVFHDVKTGNVFVPLQELPQAKAAFAVFNSPLSENGALAFEYGYNIQAPKRLVLWEAQYGDFVDGAQMIIDEFIASARNKWGQTPSLGLLLPHGFEGAGPDHSSARPERFLELAADINMRIVNPTTAAQYYHLLRRQAALLETDPLPLIVMTPKSLLRHPSTASRLDDLASGHWQPVIDDPQAQNDKKKVQRLILCSGKVYVDLVTSETRVNNPQVAIVRIEQLYPFPEQEVKKVLDDYPNLDEVVWVQEEPQNMGAWTFMRPRLETLVGGKVPVRYVGRQPNSSPAEGSLTEHVGNQKLLVDTAFESPVPEASYGNRNSRS